MKCWKNKRGAALLEYALLLILLAILSIVAVTSTGTTVRDIYAQVSGTLSTSINEPEELAGESGGAIPSGPVLSTAQQAAVDSFALNSFSQTANSRYLNTSWTMSPGLSDCALEMEVNGVWETLQTLSSCSNESGPLAMPQFDILPENWNGLPVRLSAENGDVELAVLGSLSCSNLPLSPSPTYDIDEDCDGRFNGQEITQDTFASPRRFYSGINMSLAYSSGVANQYCINRGYTSATSFQGITETNVYVILSWSSGSTTWGYRSSQYVIDSVVCQRVDGYS